MKRQKGANDQMQRKASRINDRAMGRAGVHAADQKSAKTRQIGGLRSHDSDTAHLNANKNPRTR